ncbi:hypothetical protein A2Y85_07190 [candidate division WOR-3 bacterium RBG_13_43_14]|uniref:Glycosyl transferase family 1 domain-containing protein n=1 Tax=candidate division WOR-3 bacterium RBG_13_43_14 TaxID=1802590 RepID=A0A1F4UCG3_UNCW3|nr:MAG: hypothetical protein A2Y85_07190 [candidate division WOR-3 bacterium RBG_13_43_14]
MNILVINWQDWKNDLAGGAEVYLFEILSPLVKQGHRVIILASRGKNQKRYDIVDGFEVIRIGHRANFNFHVPNAVRALLRHHRIDIVIDDLNKIPFYTPFFYRKKTCAMVMHLFRSAIFRETNVLFALYVYVAENLIPYIYRKTHFIAISHSTEEDLRKLGVKNKISVIPSGIPKMPSGLKPNRQKDLITYVGRVKKYKSIHHFIDAVSLLSEKRKLKVMIVGDGDAKDDLVEYARQKGLNLDFTGFVDERVKFQIYADSRVVVQPSVKEGWGLTAIEAQACGTPVVCADSPGLREVVINGKTGYLYPYGDIESLADYIDELIENNDKWRSFSLAAREWAQTFSWGNSSQKLEKLLMAETGLSATTGSSAC